jgi:hypothetical protein
MDTDAEALDIVDQPKKASAAVDDMSQLLAAVTAMAETVESMGTQVAEQGEQLRAIQKVRNVPAKLPRARTPKEMLGSLEKAGQASEGQRRIDPLDPQGRFTQFQTDDIVKLVDVDKLASLRAADHLSLDPDKPILGVVQSKMYTNRRTGVPKYRVNFPDYGDDGVMETEIELVQSA